LALDMLQFSLCPVYRLGQPARQVVLTITR
jgi:hypothetical protein